LPVAALLAPGLAAAAESSNHLDLTNHWVGYISILLFVIAYLLVMAEEFTPLFFWLIQVWKLGLTRLLTSSI